MLQCQGAHQLLKLCIKEPVKLNKDQTAEPNTTEKDFFGYIYNVMTEKIQLSRCFLFYQLNCNQVSLLTDIQITAPLLLYLTFSENRLSDQASLQQTADSAVCLRSKPIEFAYALLLRNLMQYYEILPQGLHSQGEIAFSFLNS